MRLVSQKNSRREKEIARLMSAAPSMSLNPPRRYNQQQISRLGIKKKNRKETEAGRLSDNSKLYHQNTDG